MIIELWMVLVISIGSFLAGGSLGSWQGFTRGQRQAKDWLDHILAREVNANVAASHANVAQEAKDKRTAAYFASRQGQAPSSNRRDRARADQMVNGHDEEH